MELKKIKDLFSFEKGSLQSSKSIHGKYNFVTASSVWKTHNSFDYDCEAIIVAVAASGSLGRVHYVNGKFISSDLCFILTPKDSVDFPISLEFYYSIFKSLKEDLVKSTATGTAKKAINKTNFGNYKIPYYNIEEQNRLKPVFEKVAHSSEKINRELGNQKKLISKLKQVILQDAIQGKLTREWREQNLNNGNANELLELLKNTESVKKKKLQPITDDETPFKIPKNWAWCRLGELIHISSGDGLTSKEMVNGEIPVFGGNGITGYHNTYNCDQRMVTIGRVGAYCGAVHLTPKFSWITDNCFKVFFENSCIHLEYLIWLLKYMNLGSKSYNASQPVISGKRIYPLLTFLPPLEEQKKIVEKLDLLIKKCNDLEIEIIQNKQNSNVLMQAILKKAFEN